MTNPNFETIFKKVSDGDRLCFDSRLAEKLVHAVVADLTGLMEQCIDDLYSVDPSERNTGYMSQLQDWIDTFNQRYK